MRDLTLIIPAKEESESLPIFLKELENFNYKKLIVIQSEDKKTLDSIANISDIEICIQKKRGYGSALIEGINTTKTKYFCIINADGSMNPKYLAPMLEMCEKYDFIFASRYLEDVGSEDDDIITFVGNKIFSFIGNLFFKLNLSDILFTYFVGKTESAKKLNLSYEDFRICVEIPISAKSKYLTFSSLPSHERKRIAGKKKVNPIKDGFLILTAMISLFCKKFFNK